MVGTLCLVHRKSVARYSLGISENLPHNVFPEPLKDSDPGNRNVRVTTFTNHHESSGSHFLPRSYGGLTLEDYRPQPSINKEIGVSGRVPHLVVYALSSLDLYLQSYHRADQLTPYLTSPLVDSVPRVATEHSRFLFPHHTLGLTVQRWERGWRGPLSGCGPSTVVPQHPVDLTPYDNSSVLSNPSLETFDFVST